MMMKNRFILASLAALACLSAGFGARAQQEPQSGNAYLERQRDLAALAGVFGELHHVRRLCEPRYEANVWRERMKKMVDLEQPQADARERMVTRFNNYYRTAERRYRRCDRRARNRAADRAAYAEEIIARLTAPLRYDEEPEAPLVMTINPITDD